jgi:hypothetical protein
MSVKHNRTTDEMATSYRTSTMKFRTMVEIRTMSRCTSIVRHAFLCHTTRRTTKMHCRTTNFVRCHRTALYDRTTACGDFIVLLR